MMLIATQQQESLAVELEMPGEDVAQMVCALKIAHILIVPSNIVVPIVLIFLKPHLSQLQLCTSPATPTPETPTTSSSATTLTTTPIADEIKLEINWQIA